MLVFGRQAQTVFRKHTSSHETELNLILCVLVQQTMKFTKIGFLMVSGNCQEAESSTFLPGGVWTGYIMFKPIRPWRTNKLELPGSWFERFREQGVTKQCVCRLNEFPFSSPHHWFWSSLRDSWFAWAKMIVVFEGVRDTTMPSGFQPINLKLWADLWQVRHPGLLPWQTTGAFVQDNIRFWWQKPWVSPGRAWFSQWCLRIWPPRLKLSAGLSHFEVVVFADNDSSIAPKPCRFMRGTASSSALQLTFQVVSRGSYLLRAWVGPSHLAVVQMWGVG